jgi:hypothetical protein
MSSCSHRQAGGVAAPVWCATTGPGWTSAGDFMNTIDEHIQKDRTDIETARAAGDLGKVRHLEEELKGLEEYKAHHPEENHDPTPLEVFCDLNPEAPECRVYDD